MPWSCPIWYVNNVMIWYWNEISISDIISDACDIIYSITYHHLGTGTWRNPFGYLPGRLYGFLQFYGIMSLVYLGMMMNGYDMTEYVAYMICQVWLVLMICDMWLVICEYVNMWIFEYVNMWTCGWYVTVWDDMWLCSLWKCQ